MFERRSLKGPITLGVAMIVLVVLLIAGWVSITVLLGTNQHGPRWIYWVLLATGSILLVCILLGVIAYLTLSVKAINLNRRQSNFIDSVTHELKSPIASLKLYLQTLTLRSVDEEQRVHFQKFMLEDLERLDQLITHLLEAGRIERDALPGEDEEVRIDEVLALCAESVCLRYRVPLETIKIELPPLTIVTKPIQVEILFRNLLDNAIKYGGRPPEVVICGEPQGADRLVVRVLDNGPGIPAKLKRKIFGRFVRLGNELERSQPGTGLGLYLVRNIVRSLHGTVRVHDRKEGPGTEFEVTLSGPIQGDAKKAAGAADDPSPEANGHGGGEETSTLTDRAHATKQFTRFRFPWYESMFHKASEEQAAQQPTNPASRDDDRDRPGHENEAER